jgi:hypothetical protein
MIRKRYSLHLAAAGCGGGGRLVAADHLVFICLTSELFTKNFGCGFSPQFLIFILSLIPFQGLGSRHAAKLGSRKKVEKSRRLKDLHKS